MCVARCVSRVGPVTGLVYLTPPAPGGPDPVQDSDFDSFEPLEVDVLSSAEPIWSIFTLFCSDCIPAAFHFSPGAGPNGPPLFRLLCWWIMFHPLVQNVPLFALVSVRLSTCRARESTLWFVFFKIRGHRCSPPAAAAPGQQASGAR